MRAWMLTAAAVAMCAAPNVAAAQSGYLGLEYRSGTEHTAADHDFDGPAINGVVAFDAGTAGVQLDGDYNNMHFHGIDIDAWGAGAHIFHRDENWQWGGAIAYGNWGPDGLDVNTWTVAGETLFFQPRTTWSAVLSYSDTDASGADAWGIDGGVRQFISDNFRIDGNVGVGSLQGTGGDESTWSASVDAEYELAAAPFSIYGGYRYYSVDASGGVDTGLWSIGVRWSFGSASLLERDRHGPNLQPLTGPEERIHGNVP